MASPTKVPRMPRPYHTRSSRANAASPPLPMRSTMAPMMTMGSRSNSRANAFVPRPTAMRPLYGLANGKIFHRCLPRTRCSSLAAAAAGAGGVAVALNAMATPAADEKGGCSGGAPREGRGGSGRSGGSGNGLRGLADAEALRDDLAVGVERRPGAGRRRADGGGAAAGEGRRGAGGVVVLRAVDVGRGDAQRPGHEAGGLALAGAGADAGLGVAAGGLAGGELHAVEVVRGGGGRGGRPEGEEEGGGSVLWRSRR